MPLLFASLRSALDQDHRNSGFLTRRECSRCPAIILPLGRALMAKPWGALSPQAQFLLFCRLGLGTTEEVFSMCDYSLQNVKARRAKVGRQADYPQLLYWNSRVRCAGRSQRGGLRSSGNGARLCQAGNAQPTCVVWLEGEYDRPYDGDLPASQ